MAREGGMGDNIVSAFVCSKMAFIKPANGILQSTQAVLDLEGDCSFEPAVLATVWKKLPDGWISIIAVFLEKLLNMSLLGLFRKVKQSDGVITRHTE